VCPKDRFFLEIWGVDLSMTGGPEPARALGLPGT
jgi:hypothetical protein